jgi:hypothetical protein
MESEGSLPHSQEPAYRRISQVPRLLCMICNVFNFLQWGIVSTSPNRQAGGPSFVGCPQLVI